VLFILLMLLDPNKVGGDAATKGLEKVAPSSWNKPRIASVNTVLRKLRPILRACRPWWGRGGEGYNQMSLRHQSLPVNSIAGKP